MAEGAWHEFTLVSWGAATVIRGILSLSERSPAKGDSNGVLSSRITVLAFKKTNENVRTLQQPEFRGDVSS